MVNSLNSALIERAKNGDQNAFAELIRQWRIPLSSYLFKMTGSKMAAEDAIQDTLVKIWTNLPKYNDDGKFASWLFSVAHNTAVDYLRKNEKFTTTGSLDDWEFASDIETVHKKLETKELEDKLASVIDKLPEKQKNVFLMRQDAELSFKEIAEITKQPLNTVLSHMNYAVKKIREHLKDHYNE